MNSSPIIVKRGFLTALAQGIFATLITVIVCGAAIGAYALNIVDRKLDLGNFGAFGQDLVEAIPAIREALPPVLSDALNDHRAPEYVKQLDLSARLLPSDDNGWPRAVIEVVNNGDQMVTLLALRLAALDEDGTPVDDFTRYVATPFACDDDEWAGPLLPGATARHVVYFHGDDDAASIEVSVADIRVWNGADEHTDDQVDEHAGEQTDEQDDSLARTP